MAGDAALDRCRVATCGDAWALLGALDCLKGAEADLVVVDAPARVLQPLVGGDRNFLGHQLLARGGVRLPRRVVSEGLSSS